VPTAIPLLLLLLGLLTLAGTVESVLVEPLMRRYAVPACCRRRVDTFEARARWTMLGAGAVTLTGLVLLFL
jgi:hypothetical protein